MLVVKLTNEEAATIGATSSAQLKEFLMAKSDTKPEAKVETAPAITAPATEPTAPAAAEPAVTAEVAPVVTAPAVAPAATVATFNLVPATEAPALTLEARIAALEAAQTGTSKAITQAKTDAVIEACVAQGVPPVTGEAVKPSATKEDLWKQYQALQKTDKLKASEFYRTHRAILSPF